MKKRKSKKPAKLCALALTASLFFGTLGSTGVWAYPVDFQKYDEKLQEAIMDAFGEVDSEMGDVEKLLKIHDYIVENTEFDYDNFIYDTVPAEAYTAYGVLVNGSGVANGYAEAFRMLCNLIGIEAITISSPRMDHVWNMVYVNDHWYHVDVAWDDSIPDGELSHKCFLKSDDWMSSDKSGTGGHYRWESTAPKAKDTDMDEENWDEGTSEYLEKLDVTPEISLNRTKMRTFTNTTSRIQAISNIDEAVISAESANPDIAEVKLISYEDGITQMNVIGVSEGKTTLHIMTASGVSEDLPVTVAKPTGSITLDTASYTMAPGNKYTIGVTLRDKDGKELMTAQVNDLIRKGTLKVRDSRTGSIVKMEQQSNGNFRVTGVKEGITYILYEINGTHASVKIEVKKGAQAKGSAVRNTSYWG